MVKKGDWVTTGSGGDGIVRRAARDGSWADVDWGWWTKRMPTTSLIVKDRIVRTIGGQKVTIVEHEA